MPRSVSTPRRLRLAINGFGRIGRTALRSIFLENYDVEVVAVNTGNTEDPAAWAHLFRYDSLYGRFPFKKLLFLAKKTLVAFPGNLLLLILFLSAPVLFVIFLPPPTLRPVLKKSLSLLPLKTRKFPFSSWVSTKIFIGVKLLFPTPLVLPIAPLL